MPCARTMPPGRISRRDRVRGLYAVTPDLADTDALAAKVAAAKKRRAAEAIDWVQRMENLADMDAGPAERDTISSSYHGDGVRGTG